MGMQSTAKTIFLLVSMSIWLIFGAALMYLFPWAADWLVSSELTHRWMETLGQGGYDPTLGFMGGGAALSINILGNVIWYGRFEKTMKC
jgi:hypothetical protein